MFSQINVFRVALQTSFRPGQEVIGCAPEYFLERGYQEISLFGQLELEW